MIELLTSELPGTLEMHILVTERCACISACVEYFTHVRLGVPSRSRDMARVLSMLYSPGVGQLVAVTEWSARGSRADWISNEPSSRLEEPQRETDGSLCQRVDNNYSDPGIVRTRA
ncbi:hypothetical protein EDC04DRAFT_2603586 [Pisolithus marmoratus]|nr:hypothetical protein EDC04DRAFT_2603586 [Pisolithus marmoratus]